MKCLPFIQEACWGVCTMKSRVAVFFLPLSPFSAQPAPVSSWAGFWAVAVTNRSCARRFPFGRYSCLYHLLAYPSSPWYSPSLHHDLESPLQEPRESSPALTDCHKWPDVYMSTSLVWPPHTFLGLAIHDIQMPHQLLFLILACTLTSHGPLTKERLFFLWEGDALKRKPVEAQPKNGVLEEGNAHLADLNRELNPSDPWNKGNQN